MTDHMTSALAADRTVVILGAGGYLGGALCRFFHSLNLYKVVAISRSRPSHNFFSQSIVADVFKEDWARLITAPGPMTLINCAFDFKAVSRDGYEEKYAIFERNIVALSRTVSPRLINISTMSAFDGCRTDYGREKLFVEKMFSRINGVNVRPGLISSWRHPGAALLNLIDIVKNSKVIPALAARGSGFYFCDLEAVVLGIYILSRIDLNKAHTISFCYRGRLSLIAIIRSIESRLGIHRLKVPVPWRLVYQVLLVKEAFMGKAKVRADSILDFAHPTPAVLKRQFFARLVGNFYRDLQSIPFGDAAPGDFYFLERQRHGATSPQICRRNDVLEDGVMPSLGRLANT